MVLSDSGDNPYKSPPLLPEVEIPLIDRPIELGGCLQVADAVTAMRLATRFHVIRTFCLTAIVAVFYMLLFVLALQARPHAAGVTNTILVTLALVIPAIFAAAYSIGRNRLQRQADRHEGWFAPSESTFSSEGIIISTAGSIEHLDWSMFSGYRASRTVAVLLSSKPGGYLIVARSKLRHDAMWLPLLELIATKLPQG